MALNKVFLLGNLGKDPEIRTTEQGVKVAQFPLATSDSYKDRNGNKIENTEWHNIVAWRGLAEICEKFVRKGSQILVEGKLATRNWEDQSGQKHYITEIVAGNIQLIGRKSEGQQAPMPTPPPEPAHDQQPRQSITEAAAHVAAMQQKSRGARPITTPLVQPEDISDDQGSDDLPF